MSEERGQGPPRIAFKDGLEPELLRALALSLGVHIAAIAGIVAWPGLVASSPTVTAPVYTVALVTAPKDSAILSIGPLSKPARAPKARPEPKTRRLVDPTPAPKVALKKIPASKPKARAPAPPKKIRPAAPAPAPVAKAAAETRALEFVSYYEQMLDNIKSRWVWVGSPEEDLAVTVRFGITESGELSSLRLVSTSGDSRFDRSVLVAVDSAAPLGSPPPAYRREFADVEIVFKAEELGRR